MSFSLLSLLADGLYHSGQELGHELGVSRAAVWKQVQALQVQGVDIISQRGQGYCWVGGAELLSVEAIAAAGFNSSRIDVLSVAESTNKVALSRVLDGAPSGTVVLAESQTGGRGRRGRVWVSPPAQNLYCSVIYRATGGVQALQGLSLVVGVSVAELLRQRVGIDCTVKWPNDLVVGSRKLGGILVELAGDASGECAAVIGIGLNCNMRASNEAIDQPWVSLATLTDRSVDRNALVAALLVKLSDDLSEFSNGGFGAFSVRWDVLDALSGRPVVVTGAPPLVSGVAAGVDNVGGLKINTSLGPKVFYGGEVSVRVS